MTGDLNLNPFDIGMVAASGLHAMMTQRQVAKGTRKIGDREYPFFYNPMWSLMGDLSKGPPGSYYYYRAEQVNYGWNMFDQILIRPSMIPFFDFESLNILPGVGEELLVKEDGTPNKSLSDHLPIVFGLNL